MKTMNKLRVEQRGADQRSRGKINSLADTDQESMSRRLREVFYWYNLSR